MTTRLYLSMVAFPAESAAVSPGKIIVSPPYQSVSTSGYSVIQAQSEEFERGLYLTLGEGGSRWPLKSSPSTCRTLYLQI
jgi:hypothetical protein